MTIPWRLICGTIIAIMMVLAYMNGYDGELLPVLSALIGFLFGSEGSAQKLTFGITAVGPKSPLSGQS